MTRGYEDFVVGYINSRPEIATLVDIGCGDFQVSNRILQRLTHRVRYIGCDIAANVIAFNRQRYGQPGLIDFQELNVATGTVPAGDIVTIREVFQHLSNDTIQAALRNLRQSHQRAIVTEALPKHPKMPNLDIVSGYRTRDGLDSGVYLDLPPFNLQVIDTYEAEANATEVLRTQIVVL